MTAPVGSSSAAPINFSGLASGLDTTSIVTQLMSIAAQPQSQLKNQLSTSQQITAAYQAVVGKLSALGTAVHALGATSSSPALGPTSPIWSATKVDSSSTTVAGSATGTAVTGTSLTFAVDHLAQAQVTAIRPGSDGNFAADPTGSGITVNGKTITAADGSAAAFAAAINAAGLNVRAQVVTATSGTILQLTSTKTGAANGFTVAGFDDPNPATLIGAQDAQISVGDPASGGYTVTSATNTFTGVATGLTFTVSAPATSVTLTVDADQNSVTNGVSAAVDAVNAALTTLSGYTGKGDLLQADSAVNLIGESLLSAVSDGDAGVSFATYGIELTQNGQLSFDRATFQAAYQADPSRTQTVLTDLAQNFSGLVDRLTDSYSGSLTTAIQSTQSQQSQLNTEISDWDTRLAQQQQLLLTKFAAMESAIQKLNSQGSYLTSIFNSMNGTSSSSTSKS